MTKFVFFAQLLNVINLVMLERMVNELSIVFMGLLFQGDLFFGPDLLHLCWPGSSLCKLS